MELKGFGISLVIVLLLVELVKLLERFEVASRVTCRKLIHMSAGTIFILTWPFYTDAPDARYWAAVVPAVMTIKFALIGLGVLHDPDTVKSMSRSGDRKELLAGPTIYGVVLTASTALFWREQQTGVVATVILCLGDGMADIIGRRLGSVKLPHNPNKSWAGSLAFFIFSFMGVHLFLAFGHAQHWFAGQAPYSSPRIATIVGISTLVESVDIAEIDNLLVYIAAAAVDMLYQQT